MPTFSYLGISHIIPKQTLLLAGHVIYRANILYAFAAISAVNHELHFKSLIFSFVWGTFTECINVKGEQNSRFQLEYLLCQMPKKSFCSQGLCPSIDKQKQSKSIKRLWAFSLHLAVQKGLSGLKAHGFVVVHNVTQITFLKNN